MKQLLRVLLVGLLAAVGTCLAQPPAGSVSYEIFVCSFQDSSVPTSSGEGTGSSVVVPTTSVLLLHLP